jgi:hypothetical protein
MIDTLLKELRETWGYDTEESNDIREKLEELAHACFWEGYNERSSEEVVNVGFTAYGKREDIE